MYNLKKKIYAFIILFIILFTYMSVVKATKIEIITETLNLREKASTDSDIVAQISIGDKCELLKEEGDWYKVKFGEYTGYISKDYSKIVGQEDENTSEENRINSINENTTLEEEPVYNNEVAENIVNNTSGENVIDEENTGEIDNTQMDNKELIVNGNTPIRIVPLINGSILENLKDNTKVEVIKKINNWSYVQTDTISGWLRTDSLTISKKSNDNNSDKLKEDKEDSDKTEKSEENKSKFKEKTMYTTDYANVRKNASSVSEILMVVDINTSLNVIGEKGDWYEVKTSQGNAFISKDLLSDQQTTTNRGNVKRTSNKKVTDEKNTSQKKSDSNNSNSNKAIKLVEYAKKFLKVPYVYGGASPSGFDCSGFTMYVYNHFGISMRHGAQAQAKLGDAVTANKNSKKSLLDNLKIGDLVFFLDYETMNEIGHCGIYIGNGNFIHASSGSGHCVKINSLLPGDYYNTRYCAARRIL